MNRLFYLSIVIVVFSYLPSFGQTSTSSKSREVVFYDPLFWKDQLKIKPIQYRRISEINMEFYRDIAIAKRTSDPAELHASITQSLEQRSARIWETFYPNQRKKWQKIMSGTTL